jgi:anti-sigma factor RsiW
MNCQQARESMLEFLTERLDPEQGRALELHLANCGACSHFAEVHRMLDARLVAAVPSARLSPAFRSSLMRQIRWDTRPAWPEFLPDIAHLFGCTLAIVLVLLLSPWRAYTVFFVGAALTLVTYFVQAVLRSFFETLE